jgi:hypothetical protein
MGPQYRYPYCEVQWADAGADTGWLICPARPQAAKWICYGCFDEIYSTCLSADYENHPCRDLVQRAARKDGMNERAYRVRCLQHQLEILAARGVSKNPHMVRQDYLERLVKGLQKV